MIQNFSGLAEPLHNLRKKNVPFIWTKSHQCAFVSLLKSLSSDSVLQPYSLQDEATLTTDASEKAIGGVLTQNGRPVMFVSKVLSKTEQRYSNIEREALAIVWSCLRLKNLLLGRRFTLITDHQPLIKIYGGTSLPKVSSSRLMRWSSLLMPFNFDIQYKSGASIPYADAVSRLKFRSDCRSSDEHVINEVAPDTVSAEFAASVQSSIQSDRLAMRIMDRVTNSRWSYLKYDEKVFFRARQHLTVNEGLLMMQNKLYVPPLLRRDAFTSAHDLQSGMQSTLKRLKMSVWWPGIQKDVMSWIKACPTCQQTRPRFPARSISSWPDEEVFARVHIDWCHVPSIGNILLCVDSTSGWIEAFGPMERSSANVTKALSKFSSRYGVPKQIVSDNAPEFVSDKLNQWLRSNGIAKTESPAYHQSSNGAAERGVQTIKQFLKVWKLDTCKMPFTDYLDRILLHHCACFRR